MNYSFSRETDSFYKILGPKDCTIRHFWEIIIQHKVEVIVMLCNLQECSNSGMMKDKCARYWPADTDQVKSIRKFSALQFDLNESFIPSSIFTLNFRNFRKTEKSKIL